MIKPRLGVRISRGDMSEEWKELGTLLRARRCERNLTLKEVENSTSIRSGYLEAIEEGCVAQFVSSVYALGFTKQYASYLGYDVDQLVREYPGAFTVAAEKHEFSYGIGTLEVRGSVGGGLKWWPHLLWASFAIVVLFLAWYLAKFLNIL